MAQVTICKNRALLEIRDFHKGFFIMKDDSGTLFWETDEEQHELASQARRQRKQGKKIQRPTGEIQIWLQPGNVISFIRPDWTLKVNDEECERGWYSDIQIAWRKVELIYVDFSFEFQFEFYGNSPLPRPVIRQT